MFQLPDSNSFHEFHNGNIFCFEHPIELQLKLFQSLSMIALLEAQQFEEVGGVGVQSHCQIVGHFI
jgi:hypothetical protein